MESDSVAAVTFAPKAAGVPQKGGHNTVSTMQGNRRSQAEAIGHVTGKFATVQPNQFRTTMEELWQSAEAITQTVSKEVEEERLTTVQGAAVVASITGSLFGWSEFHRELRPSDLALGLISGYGNGGDR